MPGSPAEPLLIFNHIPKTAGRSLQGVLRANYPARERIELYAVDRRPEWYRLFWGSLSQSERAELRCVVGHGADRLIPFLDRSFRVLCVLRHPVERALSLWHFMLSRYESRRGRFDLGDHADRSLPAILKRTGWSIDDVFRELGSGKSDVQGFGGFFDGQARQLAAIYREVQLPNGYSPEAAEGRRAALPELLGRMEGDHLVGVQDRLERSVERFAAELGWTRLDLPRKNVSRGRQAADELSADTRELILAHNQLDMALYEHYAVEVDAFGARRHGRLRRRVSRRPLPRRRALHRRSPDPDLPDLLRSAPGESQELTRWRLAALSLVPGEILRRRNLAVAHRLLMPDYVMHDVPSGRDLRGLSGYQEYTAVLRRAFPDLELSFERQTVEGDSVTSSYLARATFGGYFRGKRPTGRRISMRGTLVSRFRGDRIAEEWHEYDRAAMARQLEPEAESASSGRTRPATPRA